MATKKNSRYERGHGQNLGESGVENVTGFHIKRLLGDWLHKNVNYLTALNWTLKNVSSVLCVFSHNFKHDRAACPL